MQAACRATLRGSRQFRTSAPVRVDADIMKNVHPGMYKTWKSYTYVPHEKVRQLSPFELDVVGSLFRNAGEKFRHKVEDNFWDVFPIIAFHVGLVWGAKVVRKKMLRDHRD